MRNRLWLPVYQRTLHTGDVRLNPKDLGSVDLDHTVWGRWRFQTRHEKRSTDLPSFAERYMSTELFG